MRWLLLVILLFAGCGQKWLYTPSLHPHPIIHMQQAIGVAPVALPQYLLMDKLLTKDGEYVDFTFAGEPDWQIQKALVEYLRTALGDERVGIYPWDFTIRPRCIVKLHLITLVWDRKSDRLVAKGEIEISGKNERFTLGQPVRDLHKAMDALWQKIFDQVAQILKKRCYKGK